ncbi:tyrosine-protein phosphatase [Actinomycetospora sp. OC33-EN08]|uniref:Tyrosine-protein phosphatase n=1 Tax=Actinomycetospora aurantiaca TaxID=3129233 RepID=A0ABU8MKS7_9PSEU
MTDVAPRYAGLLGFREVAGLRTQDGAVVRPGVLYRSGTPQFLTEAAARELIADTGLRSTIDLRLVDEARREGRGPLDELGVRVVRVPFTPRDLVADGSAVAPMPDEDPLVSTYLAYLENDVPALVGVVRALADEDVAPTLVHCTLGRDRTGAAVALLLDAVGVRREDIAADYAASESDLTAAMERLRSMASYGDAIDVYPPEAFHADGAVIERYLAGVDARFGGARALLTAHGVDDATFAHLRARLIEEN